MQNNCEQNPSCAADVSLQQQQSSERLTEAGAVNGIASAEGGGGWHEEELSLQSPGSCSSYKKYQVRQKILAAEDLAAYWDTDCRVMVLVAQEVVGQHFLSEYDTATTTATTNSRSKKHEDFYRRVFAALNNDDGAFSGEDASILSQFRTKHSFVLDPFSPVVDIALTEPNAATTAVEATDEDQPLGPNTKPTMEEHHHHPGGEATSGPQTPSFMNSPEQVVNTSAPSTVQQHKQTKPPESSSEVPPPSRVVLTLPPCRLSISRGLLEDLGYLRQSLAMMMKQRSNNDMNRHDKKTLRMVMQKIYLRRPTVTPKEDARAWWNYATDAVLLLRKTLEDDQPKIRGWRRLARAVTRRARYIALYRMLLLPSSGDVARGGEDNYSRSEQQARAHAALLDMEQNVLTVEEVVAFRVSVYFAQRESRFNHQQLGAGSCDWSTHGDDSSFCSEAETSTLGSRDIIIESSLPAALTGESILSLEHRLHMYAELARALDHERFVDRDPVDARDSLTEEAKGGVACGTNYVTWTTSLSCCEFALQVNDRQAPGHRSSEGLAVAKMSCAFVLQHQHYHDGSWELSKRIGSLIVQDCTTASNRGSVLFPNLVSSKPSAGQTTMAMNGKSLYESVHIMVKCGSSSTRESGAVTTISTRVRVLPLEIVYLTAPVEALVRILSTANVELLDDYQRMYTKLAEWRERQRLRLVQALAHKQKKIVVDVDVGAPVILLPEESTSNSPLLIIDLGRIQFGNDDRVLTGVPSNYDDKWRLELKDMKVQCSTTFCYREIDPRDREDQGAVNKELPSELQQLVEPFSLDFAISTKFADQVDGSNAETSVYILASLPRLALNVTSSAIRLIQRLQMQWEKRKFLHRSSFAFFGSSSLATAPVTVATSSQTLSERRIEFHYVAPLLKFRFENDVDGRDCISVGGVVGGRTTPLLDLAMKGIEGRVLSERSASGCDTLSWAARLRALYSIDLYQGAGNDFAYLLSSVCPDLLIGRNPRDILSLDAGASTSDLVRFSFESHQARSSPAQAVRADDYGGSRLSINFSELYVEWNPETLAALHLALNLPVAAKSNLLEDDDSFIDAQEDEFFDAQSQSNEEVSSDLSEPGLLCSSEVNRESPMISLSERNKMSFEVKFDLSKLRVHFNKESRHRRLFVVEMDRTSVCRKVEWSGRSLTRATIGNLTFSDADYVNDKTLYREILGLKTDSRTRDDERTSSLLEMELFVNPKTRSYIDRDLPVKPDSDYNGVTVDLVNKKIRGYDSFVKARFSPMRFVYLQQVWFEIIDYFFEGIVGYEVWGNQRPTFGPPHDVEHDPPNADRLSFTRFDVVLSSPAILIPVSYCSTDFIRLEASSMAFTNYYNYAAMRHVETGFDLAERLQWFNNCNVEMKNLVILHCSGRELNRKEDAVSALVSLNWPVGPTALLNSPKWKVNCRIDELYMSLHQEDYALLQHVIQFNLGEESRHLEEWHVLQNLPPLVLQRYKEDIMVHFGYDKKDCAPTTFDMEVCFPVVSFQFEREKSKLGTVRCEDVAWNYKKLTDLVSRQKVTCDVEITDSASSAFLLSSRHRKSLTESLLSDLTYTSTTQPSGDNIRTVQLVDSRVDLLYPSWRKLSFFFSGLPEATFLSPKEVIQVGDRWYKIASKTASAADVSRQRFSWLSSLQSGLQHQSISRVQSNPNTPTYQFLLSLRRPSVVVGSESCSVIFLADEIMWRHVGCAPLIEREFKVIGVLVQTRSATRSKVANEVYLTEPWFLFGEMRCCNGSMPCDCQSHSLVISADQLNAKAAFSDLTVAVEAGLRFARDVGECHKTEETTGSQRANSVDDDPTTNLSILPKTTTLSVRWDGFSVAVVDDSGRHFATSQELVVVSLGMLDFQREERSCGAHEASWQQSSPCTPPLSYFTRLRFATLDVVDSLQATSSPFRDVLVVRAAYTSLPEELCPIEADEDPQFAVELSCVFSDSREYVAKVGSVDVQYNPSLVIALQRFLGRTSKDAKLRLDSIFDHPASAPAPTPGSGNRVDDNRVVLGKFCVEYVRVCLNKEHQGRQLVEIVLSDGNIELRRSREALVVKGHLGVFDAFHNADGMVKNVLKVGGDKDNFIDFRYVKFSGRRLADSSSNLYHLPEWVCTNLAEDHEIDDCLRVSIAALEALYVKTLALEIMDYLSNGMPGRGMGVTSRAAKGFVNKRIQTKSFLQVYIDSPRLLIPRDLSSDAGVVCSLGDLNVRSWVHHYDTSIDPKRYLTVGLTGLSMAVYDTQKYTIDDESPICSDIDIKVDVEKSPSQLYLRTTVSAISIFLRYGEWVSLLLVLKLNLGRRPEKRLWDNLEVAWEHEHANSVEPSPRYSKDVTYAENARHVRFGKPTGVNAADNKVLELDIKLECERMSLVLHRDDVLTQRDGSRSGYDIVLLVVRRLVSSLYRRESGFQSASFSVGELFLFDLGEHGRSCLSGRVDDIASLSSYSVLVEGYAGGNDDDNFDSQIVCTIDRSDPASSDFSISLLMNYISVAALVKPLEELMLFGTCEWEASGSDCLSAARVPCQGTTTDIALASNSTKSSGCIQVKFVLHYPRFVFIADEDDRNSRALVLEGLAMLNSNLNPRPKTDEEEVTWILKVHADFQNISSYINPDAASVTALGQRHCDLLKNTIPADLLDELSQGVDPDQWHVSSTHGFPLLLPLTLGIEYEHKVYVRSPATRNLGINVDSLSMLVSTEDLLLINSLISKWSRKTGKSHNRERTFIFSAVFETERLGLGLRKEGNNIVVDHVGSAAIQKLIESGDVLHSINGVALSDTARMSLADVVGRLAALPRPLTVTFARYLVEADRSDDEQFVDSLPVDGEGASLYQGCLDSVDVALSSAVITFMENEVTLLRGTATCVDVGCKMARTSTITYRVDLSTGLQVDYYNLRVWCWEPLLEPCFVSLSGELHDPRRGPREVSLEVGDCSRGPLCLNLSDAAVESLSKLWIARQANHNSDFEDVLFLDSTEPEEAPGGQTLKRDVTRQAANAALLFAQRQMNDSAKPFLFRNRTGVSLAFVQEREAIQTQNEEDQGFVAVGEYYGLQGYKSSEIRVVANGEEAKIRVDVLPDSKDGKRNRRFPPLKVTIQAIEDTVLAPLRLDISQSYVTTLPITYCSSVTPAFDVHGHRKWLSWSVEQSDERTVLTLATSVQIVSHLIKIVEVGVEVLDEGHDSFTGTRVKIIGTCHSGSTLFLPLWLALHNRRWRCYAKIPGYRLTPLFTMEKDGRVLVGWPHSHYVECQPDDEHCSSIFLATSIEDDDIFTLTLDCAISLRNLLPSDFMWEIADSDLEVVSPRPSMGFLDQHKLLLQSGNRAEVFSSGHETMHVRVRIPAVPAWSTWTPLATSMNRKEKALGLVPVAREVTIIDDFGFPLTLGVRIGQKNTGGIDVVVYSELWLSNCTSLPLVFGYTNGLSTFTSKQGSEPSDSEVSAAEAALKEISSLFELGDESKAINRDQSTLAHGAGDIFRLPAQKCDRVVEECFEYLEVESGSIKRTWWASENPRSLIKNLIAIEDDGDSWRWLDKSWSADPTGRTSEGWESSANLDDFSLQRDFNPQHLYRRRRWIRARTGGVSAPLIDNVNGFYHPTYPKLQKSHDAEKSPTNSCLRVALRVSDGKWAMTSMIPKHGTSYGALRVARARFPRVLPSSQHPDTTAVSTAVYELCYSVSALDNVWGELSRIMLVTSRFLLRNDSKDLVFEVKQSGSDDRTAFRVGPGETTPFHWANFKLPELISVRPVLEYEGSPVYQWSGGLDPLTIGAVPLRIRRSELSANSSGRTSHEWKVRSIQVEAEIRPGTGGTGINICFQEEDPNGAGALFRIENHSLFPLWFSQDGLLANLNLTEDGRDSSANGDLIRPSESFVFALDVPFRQGKYAGRRAATIDELLRVRLALAPLFSRSGIETTKGVSFITAGERVRLNPSKLMFLESRLRKSLGRVRVLGIVINDGPTRVLRFCLMTKSDSDSLFLNPFNEERTQAALDEASRGHIARYSQEITDAAQDVSNLACDGQLPTEEEAVERAIFDISRAYSVDLSRESEALKNSSPSERDFIVSFRAAFQGFVLSVIDSAPSEICVVSLRNVNALASWNTQRTTASTVYVTVTSLQVDNMIPNAPFPVAVCPSERDTPRTDSSTRNSIKPGTDDANATLPLLVVGISFAPRHRSGIVCLRSVTVAPRNLSISIDLAFLVRLQKYLLDLQSHFQQYNITEDTGQWAVPDISVRLKSLNEAASSAVGRQKFFFGGLTIMPCNIKLSVAPARALTSAQATLEGEVAAAIHQAVRKGDVKIGDSSALLGVRVGHRNSTPLAVVQGVFKSIVVDALLRLDGAKLNFAGVSLRNHISTSSQLQTHLGAHYFASLRQNLPALLGSLAVFGNPLGLVRGLGDGVSDFVLEPVKGFQRSVQEMDASYLVDGVARGTLSLARHTVGGFADSAAMLTETFSKNMTVLTLDRRYAQKRDRKEILRDQEGVNVALGIGSGMQKLAQGFIEGVTGVVKAPLRGAEKNGFEGFAKGIGKGLLGLLVKPIIGISDGLTDVMIGVKGSVEGSHSWTQSVSQIRPRRTLYGVDRRIRPYNVSDAAAAALMLRTRLAGEHYLAHMDMGNRVALLSVNRLLLLGAQGDEMLELLVLKFSHIESLEVRPIEQEDGSSGWGIIIILNTMRRNGSEVEVINCKDKAEADELAQLVELGMKLVEAQLNDQERQKKNTIAPRIRGRAK